MENLEKTLEHIGIFTRNLRAEMIVQREEGHYDHFASFDGVLHRQYYVDVPEIRKPNIERQEFAREELKEIYRTTPYLTARIQLGRILLRDSLSRIASRIAEMLKGM